MQPTRTFISLDAHRLHIMERPGASPALVFLHGNSMTNQIWQRQFESPRLAPNRLVAIELPGHGQSARSTHPEADYSVPAYADIVAQALAHLELKQFILVGLSLGGNVAVEMLPHLNGCIGLVTLVCSVMGKPADLSKAFWPHPALPTNFAERPTQAEIAHFVEAFFAPGYAPIPDFMATDFAATDPYCRTFLLASIGQQHHADQIQLLQQAPFPVAFIGGESDQLSNPQYLAQLDCPKWQGAVQMVPGAGHMPQWENPDDCNELIYRYVQDCVAAR